MRQTRSGGVFKPKYAIGVVLAYFVQIEVAHVSSGVWACLGSKIASMVALAHAHVPRVVISSYEVRAANERRWCIYKP